MIEAPLKSLCQIRHGGTPSKANPAFWDGAIPWVSPKDMKSATLSDASDHISQKAVENSATSVVPEKSILVVVRSGILAHSLPIAQAARPLAFNQDIKALTPDSAKVDPDYLYWFIRAQEPRVLAQGVKKGATVHSLQSGFIESLQVPLPERAEQSRIVDLLSRAQGIVRLRREAEKKAAELIPALFLDMFGDPATNPNGWPVEALSSVCSINPRLSKDQKPEPNTVVSFVPMAAVDEHFGAITRIETRLCEAVSKGYTAFQSGDVLFAKITPCMENGKAAIADDLENGLGFGSTEFHVLRPTDKTHNAWLYGLVRRESFRHEAKRSFTGTAGQQRVPAEFLKEFRLPIPPIRVQQTFNEALIQVRSIQNQQSTATTKAQATFDALLARVFNGHGGK